jgi:hypothetical protein
MSFSIDRCAFGNTRFEHAFGRFFLSKTKGRQ